MINRPHRPQIQILNREVAGLLLSCILGEVIENLIRVGCGLCLICVTIKKTCTRTGFWSQVCCTWRVHGLGPICAGSYGCAYSQANYYFKLRLFVHMYK